MKQSLACQYSLQKQMGRPPKRVNVTADYEQGRLQNPESSIVVTSHENGLTEADQHVWSQSQLVDQNVCPNPDPNCIGSYTQLAQESAKSINYGSWSSFGNGIDNANSDMTPPTDSLPTPPPTIPAENFPSALDWTNYSITPCLPGDLTDIECRGVTPPSNLPVNSCIAPPVDQYPPFNPSIPPSTNSLPAIPSCTCLADLYLALAKLSTLPSLPINPQTVETLQDATRTAHAVLYCPTCPQRFQTGMQNVMLLGTLLTVIGEGWSRILHAPARALARGFDMDPATLLASDSDLASSWTDSKERQWKQFAHYLTRQYVFGDAPPPGVHLPGVCPFFPATASPSKRPIIILQNLCNAMERRQKSWHGIIEPTGEFPENCNGMEALTRHGEDNRSEEEQQQQRGIGRVGTWEKEEHLCLKMVETIKHVLASMDGKS